MGDGRARVGCACFLAVLGCGRNGARPAAGAGGETGIGGAISGSGGAGSGGSGGSSSSVGGTSGGAGSSGTGGDSPGVGGDGGAGDDAGAGGAAAPLQPLKSYTAPGYIQKIAIDSGVIYVGSLISGGGAFTQLPAEGIVALDEATLLPKVDWQPQFQPYINDIVVSNGLVYASLDIGPGVNNLMALDRVTGAQTTSSYPVANSGVNALALGGGTMYFGGRFQTVASTSRNRHFYRHRRRVFHAAALSSDKSRPRSLPSRGAVSQL